jgi:Fe-S oxidoreductase
MFIGNYEQMRNISMRVREAALELGVKRIVVGECGHAWRVAYSFWNTLIGPFDFLDARYPVPQHICEVTDDLIQRGALQFDKEANDSRIITFHDSCNVARASRMGNIPGGQFVIPRRIITSVANHFHDMAPKPFMKAHFAAAAAVAC